MLVKLTDSLVVDTDRIILIETSTTQGYGSHIVFQSSSGHLSRPCTLTVSEVLLAISRAIGYGPPGAKTIMEIR